MSYKKRPNFFGTDEAILIEKILKVMQDDDAFNTVSSYSADAGKYPDHLIPFVDKHMSYLQTHPDVNPDQYIANLKLMTRLKH